MDPDDIVTYLDTDPIPCLAGGGQTVLKYWDSRLNVTPDVAKFCLSYVSAPGMSHHLPNTFCLYNSLTFPYCYIATSVEPERSFSKGRNQVDWNQESMEQETFNPRMVIESWADAPWFDLRVGAQSIEEHGRSLRART